MASALLNAFTKGNGCLGFTPKEGLTAAHSTRQHYITGAQEAPWTEALVRAKLLWIHSTEREPPAGHMTDNHHGNTPAFPQQTWLHMCTSSALLSQHLCGSELLLGAGILSGIFSEVKYDPFSFLFFLITLLHRHILKIMELFITGRVGFWDSWP